MSIEPSVELSDDMLALNRQLCFALYSASRAMTSAYRPHLNAMGVTFPQYIVLLALWERPGITMKELGTQLQLDYGTLSPLVRRLETAGLVATVRSVDDGRAVILNPTETSRALEPEAKCMIESVIAELGMPMEEIASLRDQVAELGRRLTAVTEARR